MSDRHIIVFDGVCNFCVGAVNFIIRRDPDGIFAFTPMQSETGQELIDRHGAEMVGLDTFLLIKNGQCYERTDAAIEITRDLSGAWKMLRVVKVLPRPIRDFFYRLFARNRYALFGWRDQCIIPTPEIRNRFLE